MNFRTVIIDDESLAIKRLERLLESWSDVIDIVGTADNGPEAVDLINGIKPDLVFLDIQMPGLTGFDVLNSLDYTPLVIFSTAYDEYALKAFEVDSIDYLLKPVDPVRLEKAILKLQRLSKDGGLKIREQIERVLQRIDRRQVKRIQVRLGDTIKLIPLTEIVFFRASDKYVEVHTLDRSHLLGRSLSNIEKELPVDDFIRIHRSAIINVNFIDEISKGFSGSYFVRMKDRDGSALPVSRGYRSRLDLK